MSQLIADPDALASLREENAQLRKELAILHQRDQRYRTILTSATEYALIVTDLEGRIIEWNAGAESICGWTKAEIMGQSAVIIFTPEDRAAQVPASEMSRSVEQGRAVDERWHLRKSGECFWGSGLMMPLRATNGTLQGYLKIVQDRSEQHRLGRALEQSEAHLQALFEAMPVGLLVAEAPSGRLVTGNRKLEEMFGGQWPRSSSIEDYASWDCFHPDGSRVQPDEYPLARALRGEDHPTLEVQIGQDDDTSHWICITGTSVRDQAGTIMGALATIQSIDRTKRVEMHLEAQNVDLTDQVADGAIQLQESQRDLLAAETRRESAEGQVRQLQKMDAVGQLTGGVAHDFNNMLSVIISGLSLAQRRLARGDSNITQFINAAMDGAVRAGTLTQRLLAFSRQQPLSPVPLDPNRVVQGMSDMLRRTLGEAVDLEMVLSGGVWRIHADASQLENAILNLAVNARDAISDGGKLTIETSNAHLDDAYGLENAEVTPGQYVLIAVTDTGAGIPREIIDRVFEPFYTTKEVGKGTGLGLSQVYGFIKQSAGHVKIYSEPGYGTTLKIYLPRFYGQQEAKRPALTSAPAAERSGSVGEIILVVEDEERVRELAVAALRDLGYTVIHADGGLAALRQLDAHPEVTLLFTDIVMPGMNGRKLADEALKRRPELKVLFTTGYTRNAVVHNGVLDAGVDLLVKPYSVDQVSAKIRDVLDRSRIGSA